MFIPVRESPQSCSHRDRSVLHSEYPERNCTDISTGMSDSTIAGTLAVSKRNVSYGMHYWCKIAEVLL